MGGWRPYKGQVEGGWQGRRLREDTGAGRLYCVHHVPSLPARLTCTDPAASLLPREISAPLYHSCLPISLQFTSSTLVPHGSILPVSMFLPSPQLSLHFLALPIFHLPPEPSFFVPFPTRKLKYFLFCLSYLLSPEDNHPLRLPSIFLPDFLPPSPLPSLPPSPPPPRTLHLRLPPPPTSLFLTDGRVLLLGRTVMSRSLETQLLSLKNKDVNAGGLILTRCVEVPLPPGVKPGPRRYEVCGRSVRSGR